MCSLHSNPLLTSGIMVFTHYLHLSSFVLLARVPSRYVHLSFFCWHVLSLDFVFFFNCMNFFNILFFNCFLFRLFIVLLSSVCNCLELAMDTKELLVALGMIVLLLDTLQHVWKEDNSSSTIFLSTFNNERKILIFLMIVVLHNL